MLKHHPYINKSKFPLTHYQKGTRSITARLQGNLRAASQIKSVKLSLVSVQSRNLVRQAVGLVLHLNHLKLLIPILVPILAPVPTHQVHLQVKKRRIIRRKTRRARRARRTTRTGIKRFHPSNKLPK
jgi:hypothetical protein